MFGAGDAYREQAVKQLASARAAVSAKIKHEKSPEEKQKQAILKYWNENPPKGLSAEKAAKAVEDKTLCGVKIELAHSTIVGLLRKERKALRLLK